MKLTMEKRDKLASMVASAVFEEKIEEVKKEMQRLAVDVWSHTYGEYDKTMRALPKAAFNYTPCILVQFIDSVTRKISSRWNQMLPKNEERFQLYLPIFHEHDITIETDSELYRKWHSLNSKQEELMLRKKELYQEVMRVAKSVTTIKRLREVWPEGVEWINNIDTTPNLPAIIAPTKLNSILCEEVGNKFCQGE